MSQEAKHLMRRDFGFRFLCLKLQAMALLVFGRHASAHGVFTRMLAEFPQSAYASASRAQLHMRAGEKEAAIADLRTACEAEPQVAANWYNLGYLQSQSGRPNEAEANFRSAVACNPKLDLAWYGLGLALIEQQRYDEAATALKRNTQLQPMSPYGWYQLARVHMDRKEPEEATKIIRHLRGFEPKIADQLVRETGLSA